MSAVRQLPFEIMQKIKLFLEPLMQSDMVTNHGGSIEDIKKAVEEVKRQEDSSKIKRLEEETQKVNISLDDSEKGIVKKAKVSEKAAQEKADEVVKNKAKQVKDNQKTRE